MSVPDVVQKYVLSNINSVDVTDSWLYGISMSWLDNYKEMLNCNTDDGQTLSTVGPLCVDQDINLNQFVSEKWWKILCSWFRLKPGCCMIRRPTHSKYIQITNGVDRHSALARCESDLLTIDICLLSDLQKESDHRVTMYAWDSFEFLEYQIRRKFSISLRSKCRLWIYVKVHGNDVILDTIGETAEPVVANLSRHLSWMFNVLCNRDQSVDINNSETDPFLLNKHNTRLCVAIEQLGIEHETRQLTTSKQLSDSFELECGGTDIVTMEIIDSELDQYFTESLVELTKEISEIATTKNHVIIETAREKINEKLAATRSLKRELEERIQNLDEKEKRLTEREKQVTGEEEELQKKLGQYKEGLHAFMKEKSRIETEWRRVREQNMIQDSQITLNIGGVRFNTSLSTITSAEGSLFVDLFCGTRVITPSEDGSYFFDRDGTHFRHILNYLRNGSKTLSSFPRNEAALHEILTEARYYILTELEHLVQNRIEGGSLSSMVVGDMEIISHSSTSST